MDRRSFVKKTLAAAVGTAFAPAALQASSGFPQKPITFVVPFAPGGISDVMARAIGASMSDQLGQQVVTLNKPSPGLVLGLSEVAKAKPDGYTIGIWFPTAYSFPLTMKTKVPYDGISSFTFLHSYAEPLLGIVVKADAKWKTLQDLIDDGKANPGKLKFGTVGVNSGQHLIVEIISKQTGAKFVHVPQQGVAAGIASVLGGHIDFQSDASSWAPNVRQGQMRLLAATGQKRSSFFPDVPTYHELGFKVVSGRGSIVAPAGIPADIRAKLEAAIAKSLEDKRVKDAFSSVATEISGLSGAEAEKRAIADREIWKANIAAK